MQKSHPIRLAQKKAALDTRAAFQDLLAKALSMQDADSGTPPELSFHSGAGTLIAKATEAEHRLIDDIVAAFQRRGWMPGSGGDRYQKPQSPITRHPHLCLGWWQ